MNKRELLNIFPYKLNKKDKENYFKKGIKELTDFHKKNCSSEIRLHYVGRSWFSWIKTND